MLIKVDGERLSGANPPIFTVVISVDAGEAAPIRCDDSDLPREAVLADFEVLLDGFEVDPPFDEDVITLEYLLAAVELIIKVRGNSTELDAIRGKTEQALARSATD
jgi:hypothetical protein